MLSDRDKDYLTQKMNAMEKPRRSSSSYSGILSRYEGKRLKEVVLFRRTTIRYGYKRVVLVSELRKLKNSEKN